MRTYCNPLTMPDYPHGSEVNGFSNCRELADPTVIWYDNKWILYATIGSIYESEDYVTWKVCKEYEVPRLVAPTIVEHKHRFYLMGSESPVYESVSPYGPFYEIGRICDKDGKELYIRDPMLFADDDGKLYLYWGLGVDGIYGMEMDADEPWKGVGEIVSILRFEQEHVWERLGAFHQNRGLSFVEGAWMHKHQNRYYMIYSASGTCYSTYAWGVYQSDNPLKGFVYQENSPVLIKRTGLVTGSGHGSIVEGPAHTLWAFYTVKLCYATKYERRIAMDPVGFDEKGNLFVQKPSERPQWAPGEKQHPELDNDTPFLPLTFEEQAVVSSSVSGRDGLYALDSSMLTWWQPADGDERPMLTVDLRALFKVSAIRIIWRDVGLDYEKQILPGPFQYTVEACEEKSGEEFATILDCRKNEKDYAVDYRSFKPASARFVRLCIEGWPEGIRPGVISFTAFGEYVHE